MNTNAKLILIMFAVITLSGCDNVIGDFVDGAKKPIISGSIDSGPGTNSSSPMTFKITPGALNSATTNNGAIRGTVTTTNKVLALGSDMSMSVTISRSRLTPQ